MKNAFKNAIKTLCFCYSTICEWVCEKGEFIKKMSQLLTAIFSHNSNLLVSLRTNFISSFALKLSVKQGETSNFTQVISESLDNWHEGVMACVVGKVYRALIFATFLQTFPSRDQRVERLLCGSLLNQVRFLIFVQFLVLFGQINIFGLFLH